MIYLVRLVCLQIFTEGNLLVLVIRSIVILSVLIIVSSAIATEHKDVRLVVTGNLMGAIRECHCPSGQPGGLARRKTIFDNIRQEIPDAIFIECGRLTNDKMGNSEIKLLQDLLTELNYDIVNSYLVDYCKFLKFVAMDYSTPSGSSGLVPIIVMTEINFSFEGSIQPQRKPSSGWRESSDGWIIQRKREFEFQSSGNPIVVSTQTANYEIASEDNLIGKQFSVLEPYNLSEPSGINEITPSGFPSDALSVLVRNIVLTDSVADETDIPTDLYGTKNLSNLDVVIVGNDGHVEPDVEKSPLSNYQAKGSAFPDKDILIVRPGLYGEYILVIDLDVNQDYEITSFEWEAIPTRSAVPDSAFESRITDFYNSQWFPKHER